ncbi:hypothetical protein GM418_02285 [Maribellus comscasis]|uniref:Porin n=1 Tax=Maribellus comscasis TaxID=2681766 RepID=A0A6I6JQN0_9BACT|nr:hypothetical protein [Maribellus comscasis]QGY42522.1 hypothetical protein GM418_02285 [Maribellus comscasis]
MKKVSLKFSTGTFLLLFCVLNISAQEQKAEINDSLLFKGQLSAWTHFNGNNTLPLWSGARYIPQINYEIKNTKAQLVDFEASLNAYGNMGLNPFDSVNTSGKIKPYRLWARYSTHQLEIRAGLQKINFGSASLLRPLMWFDQVDPRDPLRLTDGVWGILGRYYFLNNANIWLWGLFGNNKTKGWEAMPTTENTPEFGGRFQFPVSKGEAALTFHHRSADNFGLEDFDNYYRNIPENRFAFDTKLDITIGLWLETTWINKNKNLGMFTNQEIINLGMDYTFGIGNGLYIVYEQLVAAYDNKPFSFENTVTFSLLNMTYPIGLFDNLSAIVYYDWTNKSAYNFVNWQKQFNKISLYFMGYINPKKYNIPTQGSGEMLFAGSGIQVMLVFNY